MRNGSNTNESWLAADFYYGPYSVDCNSCKGWTVLDASVSNPSRTRRSKKARKAMTTDVLEQKAREWWERNQYRASMKFAMSKILAAFAREIVEEIAKMMCEECAANWDPHLDPHKSSDWIHGVGGTGMICNASPIWEAFGKKEDKK